MLLLRYSGFKRPSKWVSFFFHLSAQVQGIILGMNILATSLHGFLFSSIAGDNHSMRLINEQCSSFRKKICGQVAPKFSILVTR